MIQSEFKQQAAEVRNQLSKAMADIAECQPRWNLPALPDWFQAAQKNLNRTDFNIVVCGEVKKGKSSLINAILGQDILPVGTQETTSQIFRISHAPTESFALVFDDGSREPITREGLNRYGTQTMANLHGEPIFQGKNLKYIDINVPAPLLPPGVHLIDTPGLGAMYAFHAEVTLRQIAEADAVVFLLESKTPVTGDDIQFINRILEITKDILFVQSRIDEKQTRDDQGIAAWELMNRDHIQNLERQYGDKLGKITVYPMSSLWLRSAADDEKHRDRILSRSRFNEFKDALELMIYRVSGWNDSVAALNAIYQYYPIGKRWLDEQKKALSPEKATALLQSKKELQKNFLASWGDQGTVRLTLIETYRSIISPVAKQLRDVCSDSGTVFNKYTDTINNLSSIKDLKDFAANINSYLQNDICSELSELISYASNRFESQLPQINLHLPELSFPPVSIPGLDIRTSSAMKKFQTSAMRAFLTGTLVKTGLGILTVVAPIVAPYTTGVAIYAGGKTFHSVYKEIEENDFLQGKNALRTHLSCSLRSIRHALFDFDVREGQTESKIQVFLNGIENSFKASFQRVYQAKKDRQEREIEEINRQMKLEGDKWQAQKAQLENHSRQWSTLEALQKTVSEKLKTLKTAGINS